MIVYISAAVALCSAVALATCQAGSASTSEAAPPSIFPISVWYQDAKFAPQAKAAGINIYLGVGNQDGNVDTWPERFGADNGELEAIKAAGLKAIAGIAVPSNENASHASVASIRALDAKLGGGTVIGYNLTDEPQCGGQAEGVPAAVAAIKSYDPNGMVLANHTSWMTAPFWAGCLPAKIAALDAASVASADLYPATNPWSLYPAEPVSERSDFAKVPNDALWQQGLVVSGLVHYAAKGQPVWVFVEAMGDNFGASEANNRFTGSITGNVVENDSQWSKFTPTWIGLSIAGRTVTGIVDATHATVTAGPDVAKGPLAVTGGVRNSDCVAAVNLCVVGGNEYRATAAEVKAEVWASIINGATGIEYFCHDATSYAFCLTDPTASKTLAAINADVQSFAPIILSPTVGMCSMQREDYTKQVLSTTARCADGLVTMASRGLPGMVLTKSYKGATYVIAQSDRRGAATFTFTLQGMAGKTATPVYGGGATATLDATGSFSDAFTGDYQINIWKVN